MSNKALIYVVDDEPTIHELYTCALESADFASKCFFDGKSMFKALKQELPDLIILDIMLDEMDGFEILELLRNETDTKEIPVIVISAKGEEINKVKGLNLGAADYIAKPFGVLELIARINANLRKRAKPNMQQLTYKDIIINETEYVALVNGKELTLTLKEFSLLRLLVAFAPKVISRKDIFDKVWGENFIGESRTLDIHIASLRKELAASNATIETVRGIGYSLK